MSNSVERILSTKVKIVATVVLALLALAGNVLSVPVFFGVSFIFGSIAVMLAVALLGTVPALLVAVTGGVYTLVVWGHPYALVIFAMEALVVGLLYRRGLRNLVLADLIYWLVLGAPLVVLLYRGVVGMGWEPAMLIAIKQPLNGIFNALVAGLIILSVQLYWRGGRRLGLAAPRLGDLQFHVLLTAILLAGAIPIIHEGYKQRLQLEEFMDERLMELAHQVAGRIALQPSADNAIWKAELVRAQSNPGMGLALMGDDGQVLAVQGMVTSLTGERGRFHELDSGLIVWLPTANIPLMKRWKQGRYQVNVPVEGVAGVSHLLVEQSAAPLVLKLESNGLTQFLFLGGLLLLGILAARFLSRWLSRPLIDLEVASANLTTQIADGKQPQLPDSQVEEYSRLGATLRDMSSSLAGSFQVLHKTQAGLEQQVQVRTAELNQFKSTLDRTLDCVFMFDADKLNFFYANEGALQQVGYSRDELLGMHPYDIKPHVSESQFNELIQPLLKGQEASLTFETLHQQKNGQQLPVEIFLQYIAPADEPPRFVAIVRDITERKQAEAERSRMANLLSSVLDAASEVSIIATDREGLITSFNRGAQRLLGYTAEEMVDKQTPAIMHVPEEVVARGLELSEELGRTVEGFRVFVEKSESEGAEKREWTYIHKDGHAIPVSLVVTTMRADSGDVIGFLGIAEDISERKQAETALRDQAEHTQAILDNMVDGIITIDQAGIINSYNPASEHIFGYTPEEVLGQNVKMLMPNPYHDAHDSYLRNYQATGEARIIGHGREVEGQRKDGSLFPMDLAVSNIRRQGKSMYVGMVRDISERKRVERMKSEFVSTVSHELRTPLTSISGALGLVAGGALGALPEQAQQMIAIAHKNSQRLTHLINDLLDIEKLAAGKLHFDMQPQDLMPLIKQSLEANQAYGSERRVTFSLISEVPDALVYVDGQRLMQVLSNLLSNAVKYSPEDGTVQVTVKSQDGMVRVTITDHGPGVPAAFRDRIFQKFAQADSSDTRQKGGTGLGLAITRELLEQMGGHVAYDSEEGQGASFYFDLPLRNRLETASLNALRPLAERNARRILVVEDDVDVAHMVGLMLMRAGYEVDTVYSGAQALEALQKSRYAAISLDLVLPDMNGLEIIFKIRQQPETEHLPIVVVSARVEEGQLALKSDFPLIDWLAKPIDEKRLLSVVEQMISLVSKGHPRVLHVEDDIDLHQVVRAMAGERFDFELAVTLADARARVALERFDVIILDIGLPDGSGWDLLPDIQLLQPDARVVILSGSNMAPDEARKVAAVLLKSEVSPRELLDAISTRIDTKQGKGSRS